MYLFDHPDIPAPFPPPPPPPPRDDDDPDFLLDTDATPPRLFEELMMLKFSLFSFSLFFERSKCPMIESEDAVHTMATELAIKHPPNNREYDVVSFWL